MIKVGPPFHPAGSTWDNKGKTDIAQIFISCSRYQINFMYFVYAQDGGNKLVLSDKFGEATTSHSMETVRLQAIIRNPFKVLHGTFAYVYNLFVKYCCRSLLIIHQNT